MHKTTAVQFLGGLICLRMPFRNPKAAEWTSLKYRPRRCVVPKPAVEDKSIGARRGSGAASITSSTSGHQASYTSRSHVPSLLSHGFIRPMSSQKLQMLRGGTQSPTVSRSRGPNRRLRIAHSEHQLNSRSLSHIESIRNRRNYSENDCRKSRSEFQHR
jgi:hypothetical protein